MPIVRELRRVEEAVAARRGLSMWQYAILSVVDRRPGMNQAEAADALGYSRNRIVVDLDVLEERGLLTRRPANDRRANLLEISPAGRRTMLQVRTEVHRDEDVLLGALTPAARRAFVAHLTRLADSLRLH